jgi:hypothetical protein
MIEPVVLGLVNIKEGLDILSGLILLIGGLIAGLWVYVKFIVERGILPPASFNIELVEVGKQGESKIIEISLLIENKGTSTLVTSNIGLDLMYLTKEDEIKYINKETSNFRTLFPHRLRSQTISKKDNPRDLSVMDYDAFVQPGISQRFTYSTFIPATSTFVRIFASFQYAQRPSKLQRILLAISRKLGLIQYSLTHVSEPHTIERIFSIKDDV